MDMLSFALLATASLLAVVFNHQRWLRVDPSVLGLALTLLIQISTTNFPWIVRQSAEIVNQMTSVEREREYAMQEPEAPLSVTKDKDLQPSWPESGAVDIQNLSVRYRDDLPLALDNLSLSFPAASKIGIVGR